MTRVVAMLVVLTCFAAGAGAEIANRQQTTSLWAIAPKAGVAPNAATLQKLRASGINGLVLDVQRLGQSKAAVARVDAMRGVARSAHMSLVALVPEQRGDSPALGHLRSLCGNDSTVRCASLASSVSDARRLAKTPDRTHRFVALRVLNPSTLAQLASLESVRRPILVIAPLYDTFNAELWDSVLATAAASPTVDLAVAPVSGAASPSLLTFGAALGARALGQRRPTNAEALLAWKTRGNNPCTDVTAPTAPSVALVGVTASAATVSWQPSVDNVAVTAYRTYVGSALSDGAATTPETIGGLACGVPVAISVAAVDSAGNVSPRSSVTVTPGPCAAQSPPGDTTPPSTPTAVSATGIGQSTVTLSWNAAIDNVGVSGYRLFRDGSQVGTATGTSYVFSGLSCGTASALGVAAVDAAGNVSGVASMTAATAACPDTTAPSIPAGLVTSAVAGTAATLSWDSSSDNVGVTGYRLFRDGSQVGTATGTSYVFSGLSCGTASTLGVAAVDAAGNVSGTATTTVTTAACGGSDVTPPSAPTGLVVTGIGQAVATLSWSCVERQRGGDRLSALPRRFAGGNCIRYELWLQRSVVRDRLHARCRGGRRGRQRLRHCDDAGHDRGMPRHDRARRHRPGSRRAPSTQASATLSWNASSDNVGVTGYRLFRGGLAGRTASGTSYAFSGLSVRDRLHARGRGGRRGRQRLRHRDDDRHDRDVSGHDAPSTPTGLATSAVGAGVGDAVLERRRATTSGVPATGCSAAVRRWAPRPGTSYAFSGLSCGTALHARCRGGRRGRQRLRHRDDDRRPPRARTRAPPSIPTALAARPSTQTAVTLSWSAVHRQRRRHRLPHVPERHADRDVAGAGLHLRRLVVRHDLHAGRGSGRRCRQRLRDRVDDAPRRRHAPTTRRRPFRPRSTPDRRGADVRDGLLVGVDRQRRQ